MWRVSFWIIAVPSHDFQNERNRSRKSLCAHSVRTMWQESESCWPRSSFSLASLCHFHNVARDLQPSDGFRTFLAGIHEDIVPLRVDWIGDDFQFFSV